MHAITVAIDLAKDVFELAFADERGRVVERKRLSRRTLARTLEQRPPLRVLMEACGSAHYWARRFQRQGHAVRLLPARDVRPYVRGNKTDRNDVAGILEADRCGDIAGVPVGLSHTQFDCAREKGDAYWLYVVEYATDPAQARVLRIGSVSG